MTLQNQILDSLHARKSVRAFVDRPVEPEVKTAILEAAVQAPTAGNQQLYSILDITDPALKARLAVSCDQQPFIAEAPLVLIFVADAKKWYDAYLAADCNPRLPGPGELMLAMADAVIAAQNAVVAAESLGLGSCYIGDVMERCEEHRAMLELPRYTFPAAMLVMGYPAAGQLARKKPQRAELSHIVSENRYRPLDTVEFIGMLEGRMGEKDPFEWIRAFCNRKYQSDFAQEMSRSVQLYWRDYLRGEGTLPVVEPLRGEYTVCKTTERITGFSGGKLYFIGETEGEHSLACETSQTPDTALAREDGWKVFRLRGPLAFSLTGILSNVADCLKEAKIGLLAQSTFDTDYVFVKVGNFQRALDVLEENGYFIAPQAANLP